MKTYTVAILGATGAVGREMMKVLAERTFPVHELRLLASPRSAGVLLPWQGGEIAVRAVEKGCFDGCDIVLGAASSALARKLAPEITAAGAVLVDNSSAFRHEAEVPLVVPEINGAAAKSHKGIIANPNCSTIITLMAVWPIARQFGLKSLTAATYQAVSGAGVGGVNQLEAEIRGEGCDSPAFPHAIARNVIPAIGGLTETGDTTEEAKMRHEGRKIMGIPGLRVACTCVRVPVMRCHSIAVSLETERPVTVEAARAAIAGGAGVALMDDFSAGIYPMPVNTEDQDTVFAGRIRPDETREHGLTLWCCGDQLRKGAATNTVQIAELLV